MDNEPPPPAGEVESELDNNTAASLPEHSSLISTFCEITSASQSEALFFLESHNYNLDYAISTFLETASSAAPTVAVDDSNNSSRKRRLGSPSHSDSYSPSQSQSQSSSSSSSPSRSRSPSPPPRRLQYNLRSSSLKSPTASTSRRRTSGIRTLADLSRPPSNDGSGTDSGEPQEYYTGGEKSGMLVQDPSKVNDVDAIFSQARQSGGVEIPADHLQPSSSSRGFTGTARLLTGETLSSASQQPEVVTHEIVFWSNGFTVDGGPLRRLEDPENASFLESIRMSECPKEFQPADQSTAVHLNLTRKEESYTEQGKPLASFQGVSRTLSSSTVDLTPIEQTATAGPLVTALAPSMDLVDQTLPSTSIQLRLADGARIISRFNYHHSIRDIRGFIDAARPGGSRTYQLQTVGFPPKLLDDLDQTIEQAGLANSVVIQKL